MALTCRVIRSSTRPSCGDSDLYHRPYLAIFIATWQGGAVSLCVSVWNFYPSPPISGALGKSKGTPSPLGPAARVTIVLQGHCSGHDRGGPVADSCVRNSKSPDSTSLSPVCLPSPKGCARAIWLRSWDHVLRMGVDDRERQADTPVRRYPDTGRQEWARLRAATGRHAVALMITTPNTHEYALSSSPGTPIALQSHVEALPLVPNLRHFVQNHGGNRACTWQGARHSPGEGSRPP
jgi:hypothetical protein